MFYKNVITLFICFIIFGQSLAQTAPKKDELSEELKRKSINLLNNLVRDGEQFFLPENRVGARVAVADLLWEHDEKQARTIFQNAISELNTLLQQIPLEESEPNDEQYFVIYNIRTLRSDLLLALAARDPKLALEAMQVLTRKKADGESIFEDDKTLELTLAAKITEKDPKQAYEVAKKNLDSGLSYNLFSTLEDIYKKDAELGAQLAQDILAKIKGKDTKISSPYDYAANAARAAANSATNTNANFTEENTGFTINVWELQSFLDTVKKLNRLAVKDKKKAALNESEVKELVDILAQKYVRQQYLSAYEVARIMPELTKYFPAQAIAIRRKLGQQGNILDEQIRAQTVQDEVEGKTAEDIFQLAEKKPVNDRDAYYRAATEKALEEGDVAKAKNYYSKVKKKEEYDYVGTRIESELPLSLAEKGDIKEVRKYLAELKTSEERIQILSALAKSIAGNGDKKTALALVDEARAMYSGRMKQRKNLESVLQLAEAYIVIEPEQSFALIEANMSFFNELITAGILLDEFNDYGSVKSDEVRLDIVRTESYRNLSAGVFLLNNLAKTDFDRTVSLVERFSRPEVRFVARFRLADALLNPKAAENEEDAQNKLQEYDEH